MPDAIDKSAQGQHPPAERRHKPTSPCKSLCDGRPLLVFAPTPTPLRTRYHFHPAHGTISCISVSDSACTSPKRSRSISRVQGGRYRMDTLKRGSHTLFDVRQESLSVHRPLDCHGRDDPGLTEATNERQRLRVRRGDMADQAHSARAPAVGSHYIGVDRSFVENTRRAGSRNPR
jgi:hypothetical protein